MPFEYKTKQERLEENFDAERPGLRPVESFYKTK